jgi:2-enoate reductase
MDYRYGVTHYLEGGREIDEGLKIARRLEAAGVAAVHVDAGCYDTWYWAHPPTYLPPGCMVDMAEMVKKEVKIPVITVGKLGYPDLRKESCKRKRPTLLHWEELLLIRSGE